MGLTEKDFPEVKCGDFWTRKIRTLFRRLDAHGNGTLSMDDFLDVTSSIIAEYPKMEPEKGDHIVKAAIGLWCNVLALNLPSTHRVSGLVNECQFVDNFKGAINGVIKDKFEDYFVKHYFNAVDADNDGKITTMEFKTLMSMWKAPPKDLELIFKLYGKQGRMDYADFRTIIAEYFFSEDSKSKVKNLWGILVSYKRPEDFSECGCSPIWEGKMRTMFRRLDVSGNGILKCDDFIQIGRTLAARGHLNKAKTNSVMKAMLNIWVKFFGIDKDGKQYEEIEEKPFIHNLRGKINEHEFRHDVDQLGWAFFKAVEVDGNGSISLQEYRNLQEAWNVGRDEADGMFKVIDHDKDGQISFDEYLNAWCDYFMGEDQSSPYKSFFGPIIVRHMDNR